MILGNEIAVARMWCSRDTFYSHPEVCVLLSASSLCSPASAETSRSQAFTSLKEAVDILQNV